MKKLLNLLALVLVSGTGAFAQFGPQRNPAAPFDLATENWNARWISVPEMEPQGYGVYYFRKDVDLVAVPGDYVVHVTGDNRYKLYVNETLVSLGPAKGDATHWNYETVDLAPCLRVGKNVIAALVYHEGPDKPDSQISVEAGFLLQGEAESAGLFTDKTWKCIKDPSYSPITPIVNGYYVAGPGERVDMNATIPDWKKADADLSAWLPAREGGEGEPVNVLNAEQTAGHKLRPSTLPQMERTPFTLGDAFTVPAHSKKEILLDNKVLTNAYFNLRMSDGQGAKVHVGYAESLYLPDGSGKGNRNETAGKVFIGREDEIISSGAPDQQFTTLSWRTFRYVRLQVETAAEPLKVEDISYTFTGYPFTRDARLETDRQEWETLGQEEPLVGISPESVLILKA